MVFFPLPRNSRDLFSKMSLPELPLALLLPRKRVRSVVIKRSASGTRDAFNTCNESLSPYFLGTLPRKVWTTSLYEKVEPIIYRGLFELND